MRTLGCGACEPAVAEPARDAATRLIESTGWKEHPFATSLPNPELAWQVLGAPDLVGLYGPFLPDRADEIAPFIQTIADGERA